MLVGARQRRINIPDLWGRQAVSRSIPSALHLVASASPRPLQWLCLLALFQRSGQITWVTLNVSFLMSLPQVFLSFKWGSMETAGLLPKGLGLYGEGEVSLTVTSGQIRARRNSSVVPWCDQEPCGQAAFRLPSWPQGLRTPSPLPSLLNTIRCLLLRGKLQISCAFQHPNLTVSKRNHGDIK